MVKELFPNSNLEKNDEDLKKDLENKVAKCRENIERLTEEKKPEDERYEFEKSTLIQRAKIFADDANVFGEIKTKLDNLKTESKQTALALSIKKEWEKLEGFQKELGIILKKENEHALSEKLKGITDTISPLRKQLDDEVNVLYERLEVLNREFIEPLAEYGLNENAARAALKEKKSTPEEKQKTEAVLEIEAIESKLRELEYCEVMLKEIEKSIEQKELPSQNRIERLQQELPRVLNKNTKIRLGW